MPEAPHDPNASRLPSDAEDEVREELLDELVAEVVVRREDGGEDALEQVCSANPGSAAELRRRVGQLERLRGAFVELQTASREGGLPRRFGHYAILRELGRGGMGVVYLARDERLGREVALKALTSPALAGERGRKRFEREVQAVAALEHPGIVQIYEAGEDHGAPYFTMQYVEGRTLAGVLDELRGLELEPSQLAGKHLGRATSAERGGAPRPQAAADSDARGSRSRRSDSARFGRGASASRTRGEPHSWSRGYIELVARVVLDVAEALEHAHSHGILHRDIKPSNVLVREDGRAMLFDFGLARIESNRSMTLTGDFVGTPYYVSPEQILGGRIELDARTDVYSLGVTLYELLTLRVPFEGATTQEILRKIVVKEPPPVRRLNPAVPRDLETLCQTAMAKDRDHRYAGAAELADDLRRFLQFRPVQARHVGLWTRGLRWTRRNPAPALSASLALLLVVGGPLSYGIYSNAARESLAREQAATEVQRDRADARAAEAERERARAVAALESAELQRERADRNVARVLSTVDEMLTRVAQQDLVHLPRMDLLRRDFLERALALHRELLAEEGDDPTLLRNTVRAQRRVGSILRSLGRLDEAAEAAELAIGMQRPLVEASHGAPEDLAELAALLNLAGLVAQDAGEVESPEAFMLEAVRLRERVSAQLPEDAEARGQLADAYVNLGNAYMERGRQADAEREFRRGLHHWSELVERTPDDPQRRLSRAEALINLGAVLMDAGHAEEAERLGRESLAVWRELLEEHPDWYAARLGCLKATGNLADVLESLGEIDEGLTLVEETIESGSSLLAERPDVPEYAEVLAAARGISVTLLGAAGRSEEAVAAGREALDELAELAVRFPGIESLRHRRASIYDHLAIAYEQLGQVPEELSARAAAVQARREIVASDPASLPQHSRLGGALNNLARATSDAGDPLRAADLLDEAIEHQSLAFEAEPDNPQYRGFLRNHLWGLTETSLSAGDPRRAAAAARRLPALDRSGGAEHRRAAGLLARCAKSDRASRPGDGEYSHAWEAEALELLGVALERYATDLEDLERASDLASLRELAGFEVLLVRARGTPRNVR